MAGQVHSVAAYGIISFDRGKHVEHVLFGIAKIHRRGLATLRASDDISALFRLHFERPVRILIEVAVFVPAHAMERYDQGKRFRTVIGGWHIDAVRLQCVVDCGRYALLKSPWRSL